MQIKPAAQQSTFQEARDRQERIRAKYRQMQRDWWEIGEMVKEGLERNDPRALIMSKRAWMVSTFGSKASLAKIYRSLKIAKALDGLPVERAHLLSEGNAYRLSRLKPADRPEYLEVALYSTNEQFDGVVRLRREEYGFERYAQKIHIGARMGKSAAELWYEAEAKVARALGLDIEMNQEARAIVFEAIGALVVNMSYSALKTDISG